MGRSLMNTETPNKIIAALVSVNYSDLLRLALPFNSKIFDDIFVITTKEDLDCINICSKYDNTHAFIVDESILHRNGAVFNKGAAYNALFENLTAKQFNQWICVCDSDIIFPPNLRDLSINLNPNKMYSLPRSFCKNKKEYENYLDHIKKGRSHSGGAWGIPKSAVGAGYMQLFKFNSSIRMPENFKDAGKIDHKFRTLYFGGHGQNNGENCLRLSPRPEYGLNDVEYCVHLGPRGTNWRGRKSERWDLDD
jgi:hypothetical protein